MKSKANEYELNLFFLHRTNLKGNQQPFSFQLHLNTFRILSGAKFDIGK